MKTSEKREQIVQQLAALLRDLGSSSNLCLLIVAECCLREMSARGFITTTYAEEWISVILDQQIECEREEEENR